MFTVAWDRDTTVVVSGFPNENFGVRPDNRWETFESLSEALGFAHSRFSQGKTDVVLFRKDDGLMEILGYPRMSGDILGDIASMQAMTGFSRGA